MSNEKAAQDGIAFALAESGHLLLREHKLSEADIPDFFDPDSGLLVEVKMQSAVAMKVYRQLQRYAVHDEVRGLLLITGRSMGLPSTIGDKPAFYASLGRGWL